MSCKHFRKLRNSTNGILDAYKIICSSLIYPKTDRERKLKVTAFTCHRPYLFFNSSNDVFFFKALWKVCLTCVHRGPRIYSCLHCVFFGCWNSNHIVDHLVEKSHTLGSKIAKPDFVQFHCVVFVNFSCGNDSWSDILSLMYRFCLR